MSNNKKIILTEKLVDSTFRSGLRLNTDDANNNPHRDTKLINIDRKPHLKNVNFNSYIDNRKKCEQDKEEKAVNRIKNNNFKLKNFDNYNQKKSNVIFNDSFKENNNASKNIQNCTKCFNNNELEFMNLPKEKTLKPSKSQLIRIKHLNGTNPAKLFNNNQINTYIKKEDELIHVNKKTASYSINNSNKMKATLKSDLNYKNDKDKKFVNECEKITNYSETVLRSFNNNNKNINNKNSKKTFRHLFNKEGVGSMMH